MYSIFFFQIKTKMIKTLITNEIKGSKKNANKKAKPDKFINIEKDNNINNRFRHKYNKRYIRRYISRKMFTITNIASN